MTAKRALQHRQHGRQVQTWVGKAVAGVAGHSKVPVPVASLVLSPQAQEAIPDLRTVRLEFPLAGPQRGCSAALTMDLLLGTWQGTECQAEPLTRPRLHPELTHKNHIREQLADQLAHEPSAQMAEDEIPVLDTLVAAP